MATSLVSLSHVLPFAQIPWHLHHNHQHQKQLHKSTNWLTILPSTILTIILWYIQKTELHNLFPYQSIYKLYYIAINRSSKKISYKNRNQKTSFHIETKIKTKKLYLWSSSAWSSVPEVSFYLIMIVSYSSDIINWVNMYKIILVVICDNIIVLVMTLS